MVIDNKTYKLTEDNYIPVKSIKKQIIVGHTSNNNMKHFIGWQNRRNGLYKKTAPYTIDIDGKIYEHFNPKYQSRYFNNIDLDSKTIIILLENNGWFEKTKDNLNYINWIGDIYNGVNGVIEQRWRDKHFWEKYNEKQVDSLIFLVKKLCGEFFIPKDAIEHNTKIGFFDDYEGVLYKSNLERNYTDLNPSFDFISFKEKIKN